MVVHDKWLVDVRAIIQSELECLTSRLSGRLATLEKRYAKPLEDLQREFDAFGLKVERHLKAMAVDIG